MNTELQNDYRESLKHRKGKKQSRKRWMWGTVALAVVLASAGGWYLFSGKYTQRRYEEHVDEGNRYLIQMDYEAAEICYQAAIEEAPDLPDAYEKLANIYIAQNRYEEAGELLVRGIQHTNVESLIKTYQRVSSVLKNMQDGQITAENVTEDQLNLISENLTLDATVYEIVASYTYKDYVEAYGAPVSAADNSHGGQDMRFDGFAGSVSFRSASYENSLADAVSFENLSDLLGNYGGAASAARLEELYGCEKTMTVSESGSGEEKRYYVSFTYRGCKITFLSDEKGNIYGNAVNVVSPDRSQTSDDEEEEEVEKGQRSASGYIINAVNGGGVTASVRFLKGGRYGAVERETSAQRDGSFEAKLKPGQYTVEIRATGFITSYEEIVVSSGMDLKGLNFTLSPVLETGEIRIVLTWGESPRDLDSHLEGTGSGGESVNISFQNMKAEHVANLDIDDTSSFGPETTTIYDAGGSYVFKVHNYSAGYDSVSLSESGATVKVYLADQAEPIVYTVPSGDGIWWDVCRIENGEVTPINTLH